MAKFFVGQRVRLKFSRISGRVPAGAEGVIYAIRESIGDAGLVNECDVIFSDWPSPTGTYGVLFGQLEPILPEGAQPSEFSFTELMDNLGVVVA